MSSMAEIITTGTSRNAVSVRAAPRAPELRHHDVEEDEIDRPLTHLFERLAPILRGRNVFVTAGFEPHRQREAIIVIVVDDQNDRIHHPLAPNVLRGPVRLVRSSALYAIQSSPGSRKNRSPAP